MKKQKQKASHSNHHLKGTQQNLEHSVMQTSIQTWEISRADLQESSIIYKGQKIKT